MESNFEIADVGAKQKWRSRILEKSGERELKAVDNLESGER